MNLSEMQQAVQDAKNTLDRADLCAGEMVKLLRGRLRNANAYAWELADLKRELRDFNIHTGMWKEK